MRAGSLVVVGAMALACAGGPARHPPRPANAAIPDVTAPPAAAPQASAPAAPPPSRAPAPGVTAAAGELRQGEASTSPPGLASPETSAPPVASSGGPVRLVVRMETVGPTATRPVAAGDTLHSGDEMVLYAQVSQPAYLYVLQFFADGTSAVLFPQEGDVRVVPDEPVRVPPRGQRFRLDDAVGEENVYVVAAGRPLAEVDRAVAAVVHDVRVSAARPAGGGGAQPAPSDSGAAPAGASPRRSPRRARPTPVMLSMLTRRLEVVTEPESQALSAEADARGLVAIRFSIHHAARARAPR